MSTSDLKKAVAHIGQRIRAAIEFNHEFEEFERLGPIGERPREPSEKYVRQVVAMLKAGRKSGRFSQAQYLFHCSFWINRVHENRWFNADYPELEPIHEEMERIERKHDLLPEEFWPIGEGPKQYQELNRQYEEALDSRVEPTFREFDLRDVADMYIQDRARYDDLVELGRRSLFNPPGHITRAWQLFERFKREAELAIGAQAFYAAATFAAAALEALLLFGVLKHPAEVEAALQLIPRKNAPRRSDPLQWGLGDLIRVAHRIGWFPDLDFLPPEIVLDLVAFADSVREIRNLIHPGRHLRGGPAKLIDRIEAEDAMALLTIVEHVFEIYSEEGA